jgi:hypothetical protein
MSRSKLTGRTNLGKAINSTKSRTDDIKVRKTRYAYGLLKSSVEDSYRFYVTILDEQKKPTETIGPIPLIESPEDLAQRFGSPKEMEGNYMVRITYSGPFIQTGVAQIMKNITNRGAGIETDLAEKSNQLPVQGTAFAPPGAGVI